MNVSAWITNNLLAAFLPVLVSTAALAASDSPIDKIPTAEELFQLEDFERAIAAAEEILNVSPECKSAVLCKARSLARIDQRAEALETLDAFLQNHPQDRDALLAKGSNLARLGKNEEALSIFTQITQDHPEDGLAWYNLATSQRELNQFDAALGNFQKSQSLMQTSDERVPGEFLYMVNYQQGLIYAQKNDYKKAAELYLEAIRECPWEEEARYQLGMASARLGKKEDSKKWIDSFKKIQDAKQKIKAAQHKIAENPMEATPHLAVAQLYDSFGDIRSTERSLIKSLKIIPGEPNLLNFLGVIYVRQERFEEARKAFESANIGGNNLQSLMNLGSLSFQQGRLEDAQQYYTRILQIQPDFAPAQLGLRKVHQQKP